MTKNQMTLKTDEEMENYIRLFADAQYVKEADEEELALAREALNGISQ